MLSICIPLYNKNASPLVHSLIEQCKKENIDFEVIVIDDASPIQHQENNSLNELENTRFIPLDINVGRSKIRNLFLDYSNYNHLLFIDGDLSVNQASFIGSYVQEIKNNTSVTCGGITFSASPPEKTRLLRWKNTKFKESLNALARQQAPYTSFMTGCFLIKKSILEQIKFNEKITGYGHEDTLFGYELMKHDISITHINNPILVNVYDTNEEFISKTEQAIQNLNTILEITNYDEKLIRSIKLLNTLSSSSFLRSTITKKISSSFIPLLKKMSAISFMPLAFFDLLKLFLAIKYINLQRTS